MDIIKHISVFNPATVGRVVVIGCGAVGSRIAMALAKLGIQQILLIDNDVVSEHNIPNQCFFGPEDVGRPKVDIVRREILRLTRCQEDYEYAKNLVSVEDSKYEPHMIDAEDIVFVCVDSMETRRAIYQSSVSKGVKFLIETRMTVKGGAVYGINPTEFLDRYMYDQELYSDDEVIVERAACGTIPSIGATAGMCENHAIWMFISAVNNDKRFTVNEILFSVNPWTLSSRSFI